MNLDDLLGRFADLLAEKLAVRMPAQQAAARLVPVKSTEGLLGYRARLQAIREGALPGYRHRGRTFIDLEEEAAFVRRHRVSSEPAERAALEDEVDALIRSNEIRRAKRKRRT